MSRKNALWAGFVLGGAGFAIPSAQAGITGSQVTNYDPGTVVNSYWGAPYTNQSAALGTPDATQNVPDLFSNGQQIAFADNSAITPFNASYNPANVVAIQNSGGTITVQLNAPVIIGSGAALGIHAGVGLQDASFPNGQNSNPALTYTDPRMADLQVSDGTKWVDLGNQSFSNPTNTFSDATDPTGVIPGKTAANFFQPFFASLSSFNGENLTQTLATLDGSAGGNWFDLSSVGLSQIDFVKLSTTDGEKMFLDSVVATSTGSTTSPPPPVSPPPVSPPPVSPPPVTTAVPLPNAAALAATLAPFAALALRRRQQSRL